jgi:hypothetical protein
LHGIRVIAILANNLGIGSFLVRILLYLQTLWTFKKSLAPTLLILVSVRSSIQHARPIPGSYRPRLLKSPKSL